jgi:hypothetical protein
MKQGVLPLMILSLMETLDHSSCAHYVTLQRYFSRPSLVNYFFPTPTTKLELGLQIRWRLLRTNHMEQSL